MRRGFFSGGNMKRTIWPTKILTSLLAVGFFASACSSEKAQFVSKSAKIKTQPGTENAQNGSPQSNYQASAEPAAQNSGTQRVVEKSFVTSSLVNGSSHFSLSQGTVESTITMRLNEIKSSTSFTQVERATQTEQFTQGSAGTKVTETFQQENLGLLDIMIVIDNSGSMAEEQTNLSTKLSALLSSVKDSNWQIGVITTDKSKPDLRGIIKKGDVGAETAFKNAVTAGTSGSGDERGIYQAVTGLKTTGFLRSKSAIAVLIVSDEDNCSTGPTSSACLSAADKNHTYLTDYLKNEAGRALSTEARVFSIIYRSTDSSATCSTASNKGTVYEAAVTATGGATGSICAADYTATLNAMSINIASILKNQWALKQIPDAGSLKVFVNDVEISAGFTLSASNLTFSEKPALGAAIRVEYTTGSPGAIRNLFPLQKYALEGSATVLINGAAAPAASYTLKAGTPASLVFNTTPPEAANIRITYKEDSPLTEEFNIGLDVKPESVAALVNGAPVTASYDAATGTVRLASSAAEGSKIDVNFVKFSAPNLRFPLVGTTAPANLQAHDAISGDVIAVTFENGTIVFKSEDFVNNREVHISYRNDASSAGALTLPVTPVLDSVIVKPEVNTCTGSGAFGVESNMVTLRCSLPGETGVSVEYKYVTNVLTKFDMSAVENCDQAKWEVFVNEKPLAFFKREGCFVIPTTDLPAAASVKIRATIM
jgi:hypothetical protein